MGRLHGHGIKLDADIEVLFRLVDGVLDGHLERVVLLVHIDVVVLLFLDGDVVDQGRGIIGILEDDHRRSVTEQDNHLVARSLLLVAYLDHGVLVGRHRDAVNDALLVLADLVVDLVVWIVRLDGVLLRLVIDLGNLGLFRNVDNLDNDSGRVRELAVGNDDGHGVLGLLLVVVRLLDDDFASGVDAETSSVGHGELRSSLVLVPSSHLASSRPRDILGDGASGVLHMDWLVDVSHFHCIGHGVRSTRRIGRDYSHLHGRRLLVVYRVGKLQYAAGVDGEALLDHFVLDRILVWVSRSNDTHNAVLAVFRHGQ